MTAYILRRLLQTIPVLVLSSILVFALIRLIPGDPALVIAGPDALPEQVAAVRERLGLDQPIWVQYLIWARRVLQGDLGVSVLNSFPVAELIWLKFGATLQLTLGATVVSLLISFPLGILSAVRRGSWIDRAASIFMALTYAIPTFWLGILLVLLFALQLRWLPPSGNVAFSDKPWLAFKLLILPSVTLGLYTAAVLTRFLKTALLEIMNQDFIRTARAKGLAQRGIIARHMLKNALIPFITVFGLQIGVFLGGSVVTESIFDWPGMGRMMLHAIQTRDYPVLQGGILFIVVGFIIVNLITDLTYAIFDPRIRYQ
ncbi:MAG: ABC transporter permease [Caldilineaceae bacterium]